MSDANTEQPVAPKPTSFPFITVSAALGALFTFLFLMWLAASKENPLAEPKPESGEVKAAPNLDEIKARNEAALKGVGAKMSREEARGKLLGSLKTPNDKLPFPTPEPPQPEIKKDAKEKKP